MVTVATMPAPAVWRVGDVIEDSYGNPAVVLSLHHGGRRDGEPSTIMQTVGSDLGHVTGAPWGTFLRRVTDPDRAEAARERARAEWRRRHMRRSPAMGETR